MHVMKPVLSVVITLSLLSTTWSADLKELVEKRKAVEARISKLQTQTGNDDKLQAALAESFDVAAKIQLLRIETIEENLAKLKADYHRNLEKKQAWIESRIAARKKTKSISPEELKLISAEAWSAWRKQDWRTALKKFKLARTHAPKDANVLNGLGWTQFNIGDAEAAQKTFEAGLKIEPNHGGLTNGYGQCLLATGKFDEAIEALRKSTEKLIEQHGEAEVVQGQMTASWLTLIRVANKHGKHDVAIDWAKRYLKHAPTDQQVKQLLKTAQQK